MTESLVTTLLRTSAISTNKDREMLIISASVGRGGTNKASDVRLVQELLNTFRSPSEQLAITGVISDESNDKTIEAIEEFQSEFVRIKPDGRVDIEGQTIKVLAAGLPEADQLSGTAWFNANQARYPTSTSLDDLSGTFRDNAKKFHKALTDAGVEIGIIATYRHPLRALLMHYCWRIAKGDITPEVADRETRFHEPDLEKLNIRWDHGVDDVSRRAAQEMVDKFGISKTLGTPPALNSRHRHRNAIDMEVSWESKSISIKGADGKTVVITSIPKNEMNKDLHKVAFGYGVIKFGHRVVDGKLTGIASTLDRNHWSDTGK